jgi:poly-beta-1,6-N-acetyl-D-glucosamine biosynthesis protein PgaD
MKAETILIDQPEKQSVPRRIFYALATVIAWFLWGLLWLPVLHAIASHLDLPADYVRWLPRMVTGGAGDLIDLAWLPPAGLLVFLSWSLYESRRRRGARQRRRTARPVPLPDAAESLGATTGEAVRIQNSRRAVLHVDGDGHLGVASADVSSNIVDLNARRRKTG